MYAVKNFDLNNNDSIFKIFSYLKESNFAKFKNNYSGQKISLYGFGDMGNLAASFFENEKLNLYRIIDKKFTNHKKEFNGKMVIFSNPSEIKNSEDELCLISIVNYSYSTILNDLPENKFNKILPFYDFVEGLNTNYPITNGWITGELKNEDWEKLKFIIENFSDKKSKANFLQFLAWRYSRDEYFIHPFKIRNNRYFPSFISNLKKEDHIYVDVGAHHGYTFKNFLRKFNKQIVKSVLFEPDTKNLQTLKRKCEQEFINLNVTVLNEALSSQKKVTNFFEGYNYLSKISKRGLKTKSVYNLDSFDLKPSMLKIHVEGEEFNILKGSISTIDSYRPIIFITTYHNVDGLIKIPLHLINTLKNYKIYFRLHGWFGCSAVIYCIPIERYIG